MHIQYMVFSTSDGFIGTWPHCKSRKICTLMYNKSCHLWSTSSGSGNCSHCVNISSHVFLYNGSVR